MEERDAIQRCLAGDSAAFGDIVRHYQPQILALCLRMTGSRDDAADAAQQAFINCYRHLDRYDPHQPFRPWLYRIATNECIAFLRRRGRATTVADGKALGLVADPEEGAPALVDLAEDRERVRDAVATLPPQYRTVVVLYYFQELPYHEIARQTRPLALPLVSHQGRTARHALARLAAWCSLLALAPAFEGGKGLCVDSGSPCC